MSHRGPLPDRLPQSLPSCYIAPTAFAHLITWLLLFLPVFLIGIHNISWTSHAQHALRGDSASFE
jgi:hypothetical protein